METQTDSNESEISKWRTACDDDFNLNEGVSEVTTHGTQRAGLKRTHDDKATGVVMQWMLTPTPPPPTQPYIRPTLGCGRRKQGLSPCIEPSPSLVLNHAVHNGSRQWAILNYSGTEDIAEKRGLCWLWTGNQSMRLQKKKPKRQKKKRQSWLFMQIPTVLLCAPVVVKMFIMHVCTAQHGTVFTEVLQKMSVVLFINFNSYLIWAMDQAIACVLKGVARIDRPKHLLFMLWVFSSHKTIKSFLEILKITQQAHLCTACQSMIR